jgi:beta-ribofuranosylaminobenzene 5'-phosphate synthase
VRKYGGLGLMVEQPAVTVEVRRSRSDTVTGSLADRAAAFLRVIRSHDWWGNDGGYAVTANGPPEHVGLGVGTALGMAVARGVNEVRFGPGCQTNTVKTLAAMVERGRRSGVGVFGSAYCGLIVDDGKEDESRLPHLKEFVPFPTDWRAVLIRPAVEPVWHGDRERDAFARRRTPAAAVETTDRLRRIAFGGLVPAVKARDFRAFSEAVFAYNRTAGEPFAEDQGGPYAGPVVAGVIDELLSWGVTGVGQSSWGPTVFAFAPDPDEARALADRARAWLPQSADVTVTAASQTGAVVTHASAADGNPDQPDQEDVGRQHE